MPSPSATPAPPSRALVALAFASIYLIWGSTFLAIKVVLEALPPFLAAGARFLVAGAALFAFARLRGAPRPSGRQWAGAGLVGTLLLLGGNGGVMWAETRVPSGLASVLIAMVPVFMVLLEGVVGGGPGASGRTRAGVAVGLGGVALLVGPSLLGDRDALDPAGALSLLLSAFLWATGSLLARRVPLPSTPAAASGAEQLLGGAALGLAGLLAGEWPGLRVGDVTLRAGLAWAYLAVFGSIVAFSAYTWLLGVTAPTRVGTYAFVNPVVALLLGVLVAGEPLAGRTVAAAAVIVVGVLLVVTGRAAPAAPPPAADPAAPAAPGAAPAEAPPPLPAAPARAAS